MTETTVTNQSQVEKKKKRQKKKRHFLYFFIPFFIAGNIGFYFQERAKWIYPKQPYPEAKEWLVPANMMLVYGTILTKLPFIDERSFIMKPIIGLQDYFVSKWQENLPDDDAEKYVGWYYFRLRTYMVPNATNVILYKNNTYSYEETRQANDEAWKTIEATLKYKAKDKIFNEIRLSAFLNMSFFYVKNAALYWYHEKKPAIEVYSMNQQNNFFFDKEMMFNDIERMKRFKDLYEYIPQMETYYKDSYPDIYKQIVLPYFQYVTDYLLTNPLLAHQLWKVENNNMSKESFCNGDTNEYLVKHMNSKEKLVELSKTQINAATKSLDITFNASIDSKIEAVCNIDTTITIIPMIQIGANYGK